MTQTGRGEFVVGDDVSELSCWRMNEAAAAARAITWLVGRLLVINQVKSSSRTLVRLSVAARWVSLRRRLTYCRLLQRLRLSDCHHSGTWSTSITTWSSLPAC